MTQEQRWHRRVREAEAESIRRFGVTPDPLAVLAAIVDAAPGRHFVAFIDPMVIEIAAARALGREIAP